MMRCLLVSLLLAMGMLALPVWAKGEGWIPIDTSEGLVKIRSSIGGIEGYSFIDSATNLSAINEVFLQKNKLHIPRTGAKVKVHDQVSVKKVGVYSPVELNLFGTEMTMRSLKGYEWDDADLQVMLGGNFLNEHIVQIDYPNQRMRFLNPDSNDLKRTSNIPSKSARKRGMFRVIGSRPGGGIPMVKVRLNDETNVWLLLDTSGPGGILVDRKIVQRTNWLDEYATPRNSASNIDDDVDVFVLPTVKFGPFDLGDVEARTPAKGQDFSLFKRRTATGTHIPTLSRAASGVVGYEVLKHFVVTLDFKQGLVHVGTKASP